MTCFWIMNHVIVIGQVGDYTTGTMTSDCREIKMIRRAVLIGKGSNAATTIHTSFGDYTVAGAISLRSRMRGSGSYDDEADFEQNLYNKMKNELDRRLITIENKNKQLETTAESMRLSILGKDSKAKIKLS